MQESPSPPDFITREALPADVPGIVALRNAVFAPITPADWARDQPITAAIAVAGDQMLGALPMALREFVIRPDCALTVTFANAVVTRADQRGRGVGAAMVAQSRKFLSGRVDALFLYRSDERSDGYRFYRKTGHTDLHYSRCFRLETPQGGAGAVAGVRIYPGLEAITAREPECLTRFDATFGGYGGFRRRGPGYYQKALTAIYYTAHPHELFLLCHEVEGRVLAHAILGAPTQARDPQVVSILELAALDGEAGHIGPVLVAAANLAAERQRPLQCVTSDTTPFRVELERAGFVPQVRNYLTLGLVLEPEVLAAKVWRPGPALADTRVVAWTPGGEWVLQPGKSPARRTLRLEMKDETLTRLLLGRVQVEAAVEMELITLPQAEPGDVAALAQALPAAPWCYQAIDYI